MGAIRKRPSGRYEARWYDESGKQHSAVFIKRDDAKAHVRTMEGKKVRGDSADPRLGRKLFKDIAAEWLDESVHLKPRTRQGYEQVLNAYILPRFGDVAIGKITPTMVRGFIATVQGIKTGPALSATTKKNIVRTLSPIFRKAVEDGTLTRSPLVGIKLKQKKRTMLVLEPDEIAALADTIASPWGVLIYAAAYTGARSGELCALRVKHLDLLRRRITIAESLADVAGRLHFGTTKNGEERTFAIPRALAEMLAAYLVGRDTSPNALVFTAPRGGPLRHNDWYKKFFRPAVDLLVARGKNPLNREPAFPEHLKGLRFHDLRHTCASILIAAGENPVAIADQLGHKKVSITMDVYAHLFKGHDEARAARLDDVLRGSLTRATARATELRVVHPGS